MKRIYKRILSMMLSLAMMIMSVPAAVVSAAFTVSSVNYATQFEYYVREITLTDLYEDSILPTYGDAYIRTEIPARVDYNQGGGTVDGSLLITSWASTPTFDPNTAGTYVFTPDVYLEEYDFTGTSEPTVTIIINPLENNVIRSFASFTSYVDIAVNEVANETQLKETFLPPTLNATVLATTGITSTQALAVTWTCTGTFNSAVPGTYTYNSTLTNGTGYVFENGVNMPSFTVTVDENMTYIVTDYVALSPTLDVDMTTVTTFEGVTALLPAEITATLYMRAGTTEVPITWSCSLFDPDVAGLYTFTAAFDETGYAMETYEYLPTVEVNYRDPNNLEPQTYTYDGSTSISLKNGDTLNFDQTYISAAINIEDGAKVTINFLKVPAKGQVGSSYVTIGNNAHIVIGSCPSGLLYFPINAGGKNLTLESTANVVTLASINTASTPAGTVTLIGSGGNGFVIEDSLSAGTVNIRGGTHEIDLTAVWKYVGSQDFEYRPFGSPIDGRSALTLSAGGTLAVESGSLTLRGMPNGNARYNSYYSSTNTYEDMSPLAGGAGIKANGSATVTIGAGASLAVYGANQESPLANDDINAAGTVTYLPAENLYGGPAVQGNVSIYFTAVEGAVTSSLTLQNGLRYNTAGNTLDEEVDGYDNSWAVGDSSVTVIKPAGNYLAGANWDTADEAAYIAACISASQSSLTVAPGSTTAASAIPGTLTLSTTTPDVLTYSAQQVGGVAGTTNSSYIRVTFTQSVLNLISTNVTLTGATAGTPVMGSSNTIWDIPVSSIAADDDGDNTVTATLAITGISGYDTVSPASVNVTLYKALTVNRSFTASEVGGVPGETTTEYIELLFDDDIDGLTAADVSYTYAGDDTEYGALELTQHPDNDLLWYMYLSYAPDATSDIIITIDDFTGADNIYHVTNTETVTVYSGADTMFDYTVSQVGGVSGVSDTTGILVTFDAGFDGSLTSSQIYQNILTDDERDTRPVTVGTVTNNGDSNPLTWFVPLTFSDYLTDGSELNFYVRSPDDGYSVVYKSTQYVTIYRATTSPTFIIKSYGNTGTIQSDGESDIISFNIEFNTPVTGLTKDFVTITGGEIYSVTATYPTGSNSYTIGDPTDRYAVTLTSLIAEYDDVLTITIADWLNYEGSTATATYRAVSSEFADSIVTLSSVIQVGGMTDEYGSYETTEGVRLFFDKPVTLTDGDVAVSGATIGAITDDGDSDDRTWFVPLTHFTVTDGDEITVTVGSSTEEAFGSTYAMIGEKYVRNYVHETKIYISTTRHSGEVRYTLEQVNGENGRVPSEGLYLTVTSTVDLTLDGDLRLGRIKTSGALENRFEYTDYGWGNVLPTFSADGLTATFFWDNKHMRLLSYENGDVISVAMDGWTDKLGNSYEVITESASTPIYKDTQTHLEITSAVVHGPTKLYAEYGRWTDTEVEFMLSDGRQLEGLTADKVILTPTAPGTTITKSTASDALVYNEGKNTWSIKIASLDGAGYIPFEISILPFGKYTVDNTRAGTRALSNDFRKPIWVTEAVQVGGIMGEKESTGIILTFNDDFYDPDQSGGKQWGGFSSMDTQPYFYLKVKGLEDYDQVSYGVKPVEGRKDQVYLDLGMKDYTGTSVFSVTAVDNGEPTSDFKAVASDVTVTLYDDPPPPDGRTLSSVSPRGIFVHSKKKWIALSGEFATDVSALKTVYARAEGDTDSANWIELPFEDMPSLGALRVDVEYTSMFNTLGDYEVCFESADNFFSEWRPVSVYDDPVYSMDGYGILAITQSGSSFNVKGFDNETAMKADLGNVKPILVFRGGVLKQSDFYQVQSGTVINNALTYYDKEGNDTLIVKPLPDGGVEIYAPYGDLRWKNIPITPNAPTFISGKAFDMSLKSGTKYRTDRLGTSGDPVEIRTGVNDFSVNFVIGGAELATYKLFDGVCSLSGSAFISMPEALAGAIDAGVDVEELLLTDKTIPPMKASADFEFKPGGMFGESLGAVLGEATLAFNINTLPETNPHTIGAAGTLDIVDMLYVEGELVMGWGKLGGALVIMPDKINLFARIGSGGVPLVPPTIVAYINGFGGGVSGLAQTVFGNFNYVPPVKLKAMGAVVDATGQLFEIEKATFEFGVGSFSAYANEAKIINFLKLEDVGYEFGIIDSAVPSRYGMPSVDVYFGFGGSVSFDVSILEIEGGLEANAMLRGNYLNDALIGWTIDSMEQGGFVAPSKQVQKDLYNAIDLDGKVWASAEIKLGPLGTLAGARGELGLSKTKISGKVTGKIWPGIKKTVGITYTFKGNDLDFGLVNGAYYNAETGQTEIFSEPDEVQVTNLRNGGNYTPNNNTGLLMRSAALMSLTPQVDAAVTPPVAEKDTIATLFSSVRYQSIDVYKDGVLYDIISGENLYWFETAQVSDIPKGLYSINYLIPEDGSYTFKTESFAPETEFAYTLTILDAMPEFESVTALYNGGNTIATTWTLNESAQQNSDLYTRLMLVDARTGDIVTNLTAPETETGDHPLASNGRFTIRLPDTLASGEYYISAELANKYTETVTLNEGTSEAENTTVTDYAAIDIVNTEVFSYTNPESLSAPTNLSFNYAGNGAVKASWSAVAGADGYRVKVLHPDGSEIDGVSALETTETESYIQGGLVTLDSITDAAGNVISEAGAPVGLAFGEDYLITVQAFKNKEYGGSGTDSYVIPILGAEGSTVYTLPVPKIPEISVSVEGGNDITDAENSASYIATNNTTPNVSVTVTEPADIEISVGEEVVYRSSGKVTTVNTALSLGEDGIYNVLVTATAANGDKASTGKIISLDTEVPILSVDENSYFAVGGAVKVNGFTEIGATVKLDGEPIYTIGGLFEINEKTDSAVTSIVLSATDEAGNMTSRALDIPYVEAAFTEPEDGGDPSYNPGYNPGGGSGNGGGSSGGNSSGSGTSGDTIWYPTVTVNPSVPVAETKEYDAEFVIGGKTVKRANILNSTGSLNSKETLKNLEEVHKKAADEISPITIIIKNAAFISYSTFDKLAAFAKENDIEVIIYADNYTQKVLVSRLYIDVTAYEKTNKSLSLQTDSNTEKTVKEKFGKWFANDLKVFTFKQKGSLKATIQAAVKINGIENTDNLFFYYYDDKTNKYKQFKTNYRVDKNGYLHFLISNGGSIIVSDGKLTKG